jgi:hypothetical protein
MADDTEFVLEEVATNVEERFRRSYPVAGDKDQYSDVSLGWWLTLKRLGLSMWIGNEKPAIQKGDLLKIRISKHRLPVQPPPKSEAAQGQRAASAI